MPDFVGALSLARVVKRLSLPHDCRGPARRSPRTAISPRPIDPLGSPPPGLAAQQSLSTATPFALRTLQVTVLFPQHQRPTSQLESDHTRLRSPELVQPTEWRHLEHG